MKVLLLEDDYSYRQSVKEYLESLGYDVDEACDGIEACDKIRDNIYHLLILDIKVPEISGHEVMKYAKSLNLKTPIMIMTSLIEINDMAIGYGLGCNEYLKKPFNLAELKFRVNELMRKYYARNDKNLIKIADKFDFDTVNKNLKFDENIINLSAKEIELVMFLLSYMGNYVSVDEIMSQVWESGADSADLRVHVSKIRAKTSDDFILSTRGLGYKINV